MSGARALLATRRNRVLIAGGTVALVFALAQLFCDISFLTNDDTSIQRTIAGWQTGEPYLAHPFLNILFSAPVSLLYRLFPAIAWWGRLQQAAVFVSLTVIGCCLFLEFERAAVRPSVAIGAFVLLCFGVFSYPIVRISFTLTAALCGTAAVALMLTEDPLRPLAWSRRGSALVLLLFCFLFRNSSGISILPFFLLAAAYRTVRPRCKDRDMRRARMRGGLCVLLAVALSALAIGANAYGRSHFNDPGYEEFDAARSAFTDYPHADYAEDPSLYASLGWDETVYQLVESWCFMDERVTVDALNTIAENAAHHDRTVAEKLIDALENGIALGRGNGVMQWVLAFTVGIFLWMLLLFCFRQRALLPALCCVCFALGAFLLCGYLCYTGRFLLRTFFLIAYPATISILLTALEVYASPERRRLPRRVHAAVLLLLLLPALAGTVLSCRALVLFDPSARLARIDTMYAYVLAHPDTVYIRDFSTIDDTDAFRTFPAEKPTNLLDWGGHGMYTGALRRQLALNGLPALNQDALLMDHVRVLTTKGSAQEKYILRYAEETLHADTIECVDTFGDGFIIYRFGKDA